MSASSTSFIVNHPRPCNQRAARSAVREYCAIARRVRQRDRLRCRVEPDRVRARDRSGRASTTRRSGRVACRASRLQRKARARRCVPLRRVVQLVHPGAERRMRRTRARPPFHQRRNRLTRRPKVRRRHDAKPRCVGFRAQPPALRLPAGRADHDVHAARSEPRKFFGTASGARSRSPRPPVATHRAPRRVDVHGPATSAASGRASRRGGPSGPGRLSESDASSGRPRGQRCLRLAAKNVSCRSIIACAATASWQNDGHVPPRGRLRDHPQRELLERSKHARRDARIVGRPSPTAHRIAMSCSTRTSANADRSSTSPASRLDRRRP